MPSKLNLTPKSIIIPVPTELTYADPPEAPKPDYPFKPSNDRPRYENRNKGKADLVVYLSVTPREFTNAFVTFIGGSMIDFEYRGSKYKVPTSRTIVMWRDK
jgi:hypothetical protein